MDKFDKMPERIIAFCLRVLAMTMAVLCVFAIFGFLMTPDQTWKLLYGLGMLPLATIGHLGAKWYARRTGLSNSDPP
jgi:hypothetical protein